MAQAGVLWLARTHNDDLESQRDNESEAVMQVDLSTDEAGTLKALLRDCVTDLKREIARAEDRRFRHELVQREELCERLIARLDNDTTRSPAAPAL